MQTHCSPMFGPRAFAVAFFAAMLFLLGGCTGFVSSPSTAPKPATSGALSVSASSFDFKTVVVGQTVNQNLTVTNSGQSPIQLTGLTLSNNAFAMTVGGGFDVNLSRHFAVRPAQVDYLLTRFDELNTNAQTQNNLRVSTGVVFHF